MYNINAINNNFMNKAVKIAKTSKCLRQKVCAIITSNDFEMSIGVNRVPLNVRNCTICVRELSKIKSGTQLEKCNALHAEQIAIMYCKTKKNLKMYVTHFPCPICAKMIIEQGIKTVIYKLDYIDNDNISKKLFKQAKIELIKLH
jgi:dCMP deaminase